MRYFLLTRPKTALAFGVAMTSAAGLAVTRRGPMQRLSTCRGCATLAAVHLTPIATATQDDLGVTSCAVEQSRTGLHRHSLPMSD